MLIHAVLVLYTSASAQQPLLLPVLGQNEQEEAGGKDAKSMSDC